MMIKLRQLSLVSLAHASKKVSYEELQLALGITNVRELEDLIIDTIYAGILEGRLDQLNGVRSAIYLRNTRSRSDPRFLFQAFIDGGGSGGGE